CGTASATAVTYTLSLHDALPISIRRYLHVAEPEFFAVIHRRRAADGEVQQRRQPQVFLAHAAGQTRNVVVSRTSRRPSPDRRARSEEHTSELQSRENLVCRLLLE